MVGNMPNTNYFNTPGNNIPSLQSAKQGSASVTRVQLYTAFIDNISDVQVCDISQDGVTNLFITRDYSHIYAKAWNANGYIDTVEYIIKPNDKNDSQTVTPEAIMAAVTSLQNEVNSRLTKVEQQIARPQNYKHKPKNYNNTSHEKSPNKGELNNGQ